MSGLLAAAPRKRSWSDWSRSASSEGSSLSVCADASSWLSSRRICWSLRAVTTRHSLRSIRGWCERLVTGLWPSACGGCCRGWREGGQSGVGCTRFSCVSRVPGRCACRLWAMSWGCSGGLGGRVAAPVCYFAAVWWRQNGGVARVFDGEVGLGRGARFVNRELSALDFNERVFGLACDGGVPLLERVRFLSIVASNLDEFFMVRVAGLMSQLGSVGVRSLDGRTAAEVLVELRRRIVGFSAEQGRLGLEELCPALGGEGIVVGEFAGLSGDERARVGEQFERDVFPILTPLAVSAGQPFPYVSGLSLSLGLLVRHRGAGGWHLGRVKIPEGLPRFVAVG